MTVASIDDVRRAFSEWGIETRETLPPPVTRGRHAAAPAIAELEL
jgi:hypothetical protein